MCYYKLFRLLIPHKHCYYKLFHLLIPRKHVLLQAVSPVDSTQMCATTGCFCLTLIIFLGMPVIYFVPDLTAQPASIAHQQGDCNADN
jgi:hypothetical protein